MASAERLPVTPATACAGLCLFPGTPGCASEAGAWPAELPAPQPLKDPVLLLLLLTSWPGHPGKAGTVPFSSSELFPTSLTARLCYQMGIVPRTGARLGCGASAVRCVPGGLRGWFSVCFHFSVCFWPGTATFLWCSGQAVGKTPSCHRFLPRRL